MTSGSASGAGRDRPARRAPDPGHPAPWDAAAGCDEDDELSDWDPDSSCPPEYVGLSAREIWAELEAEARAGAAASPREVLAAGFLPRGLSASGGVGVPGAGEPDGSGGCGAGPGGRSGFGSGYAAGQAIGHGCMAGRRPAEVLTGGLTGRGLTVKIAAVARESCDHRHEEPSYEPSQALRNLVRARSVTCTAPGCRRPAVQCDLDHTVPYQRGGRTCEARAR